jgi:FtsZ-binding cell division protein ZapB
MQVSESYQLTVEAKSEVIFRMEHAKKRTLSPQEEKTRLVRKIEGLMSKNRELKEKQDGLQNTVLHLLLRSTICENYWKWSVAKAMRNALNLTKTGRLWSTRLRACRALWS